MSQDILIHISVHFSLLCWTQRNTKVINENLAWRDELFLSLIIFYYLRCCSQKAKYKLSRHTSRYPMPKHERLLLPLVNDGDPVSRTAAVAAVCCSTSSEVKGPCTL